MTAKYRTKAQMKNNLAVKVSKKIMNLQKLSRHIGGVRGGTIAPPNFTAMYLYCIPIRKFIIPALHTYSNLLLSYYRPGPINLK